MRTLKFSYRLYNFLLICKFLEVFIKEFVKFLLLSNDLQKRRFFWERLGVFSYLLSNKGEHNWFWIHANAIGEVNASQSLIRLIKNSDVSSKILLTVANFSADERAAQLKTADAVLFFPYDIPFIIKRFLKAFQPICIIIVECDVWPNFIRVCKARKIPVMVVSATYSNDNRRSLRFRYFYDGKFILSKEVFKDINCFCMQSQEDAKGLSELIPEHKNINVGGNLKFSCLNENSIFQKKPYYQKLFNIKESDSVFVAGNVHLEEIEILLDAFKIVKEKIGNIIMVLAPRFTQYIPQAESLLARRNITFIKRTDLDKKKRVNQNVILLDTIGELEKVYSAAQVAFVGGSLVYLGDRFGGHNILEPAISGVPVLFGPYMHNFQNLADLFRNRSAGIEVKNTNDLAGCIIGLISDREKSIKFISNASNILEENRGVTEKTFSFISKGIYGHN